MKTAHDLKIARQRVAGIVVLSPRPTKLAAALVATAIAIPFVIIVGVVDVLT
jgi:hypothetical protein